MYQVSFENLSNRASLVSYYK